MGSRDRYCRWMRFLHSDENEIKRNQENIHKNCGQRNIYVLDGAAAADMRL